MKQFNLFSLLILGSLSAQVSAKDNFALETDPYTFVQDGYAFHLKWQPEQAPNWRLGLGAYSLEIPSFMVDMNEQNKNKDWKVDLENGIGLFADYYFNSEQQGWYVGAQIATQDYSVQSNTHQADFTNGLIMFSAGYRMPLLDSKHWYIQPWMGLGYTQTTSGKQDRLDAQFDVNPIVAFATLHVGYQF